MVEEQEVQVEVVEATPKKKPGRRSLAAINEIRAKNDRPPVLSKQKPRQRPDTMLRKSKELRTREILAHMLQKKSKHIVGKIINKALNDEDPDQMACLKIVADRILPVDYFTKQDNKAKAGINIQIMGVGGEAIHIHGTEGESSINDDDTNIIEAELIEEDNG